MWVGGMPRVGLGIIDSREWVAAVDKKEVSRIESRNRCSMYQSCCGNMKVLPMSETFCTGMRNDEIA